MILYKLTGPKGEPVHGGKGNWSLPRGKRPGAWRSVEGPVVPCSNGLHLLRPQDIVRWLRTGTMWEVEAAGDIIDHGDKVVAGKARLVREVTVISDRALRELAADFAEHVLPIFEKRYPNDDRPRKAIEAARAFARGDIDRANADAAAAAAANAYAAAYAAAADADAAANAAAAAAYANAANANADAATAAAANAAADAATAAYAERRWQTNHLIEVLGLEEHPE